MSLGKKEKLIERIKALPNPYQVKEIVEILEKEGLI